MLKGPLPKPHHLKVAVHNLYMKDCSKAPIEFLEEELPSVVKKIRSKRTLNYKQKQVLYYFLFKIYETLGSDFDFDEYLPSSFSKDEEEIIIKGFFEFCFSKESLFHPRLVELTKNIVQKRLQNVKVKDLLAGKEIGEDFIKPLSLYSEELDVYGNGLLSPTSLASQKCWEKELSYLDRKIHNFFINRGGEGLFTYLLDFFCASTSPLKLRVDEKLTTVALKRAENAIDGFIFLLSFQEISRLRDFFGTMENKIWYRNSIYDSYKKLNTIHILMGVVFSRLRQRLNSQDSITSTNFFEIWKWLSSIQFTKLSLFVRNSKQRGLDRDLLPDSPSFEIRALKSDVNEDYIAVIHLGTGTLGIFPQSGLVLVKSVGLLSSEIPAPDILLRSGIKIQLNSPSVRKKIDEELNSDYSKFVRKVNSFLGVK